MSLDGIRGWASGLKFTFPTSTFLEKSSVFKEIFVFIFLFLFGIQYY